MVLASIAPALLVLTILSYGFLLHKLGFYWDDWPWIWYSHVLGRIGLLDIDQVSRPLAGEILWFGHTISGLNPFLWQVINLVYRWLAGVTLWWALSRLWPIHLEKTIWIAFIFLIYPGFRQQFVSVNTSRHMLPLAVFFLSIGLMVWAIRLRQEVDRQNQKSNWLLFSSLLSGGLTMLMTEYYYGLELVRPLMIFLALDGEKRLRHRFKKTGLYWLPFFILLTGIFSWRFVVSPGGNYPITIGEELVSQPVGAIGDVFRYLGNSSLTSALLAWENLFDPQLFNRLGLRIPVIYISLMLLSLALSWLYLSRLPAANPESKEDRLFGLSTLVLGICSLFVASLPFLVTGLKVGLVFPFDRTLLPMMFGASLVVVALIDVIGRLRWLKILVVSVLVSLSVGMHYLSAVSYQRDWETQRSFFTQLVTRLPGLKPGTTLVYEHSTALDNFRSTDNSLLPVLNWVYHPDQADELLRYYLADLRLRQEFRANEIEKGMSIYKPYGPFIFKGSTDDMLVLQFAPPWCINVLDPEFEGLYPNLPEYLPRAVTFSNLKVIDSQPATPVQLPEEIFGKSSNPDWCIYYQQASLAAQSGEWDAVVGIAEKAFALNDPPRQPTERMPFILGYGFTADWSRAEDLSLDTRRRDANSEELLCAAWRELHANAPPSPEKERVVLRMLKKFNCPD